MGHSPNCVFQAIPPHNKKSEDFKDGVYFIRAEGSVRYRYHQP